LPRTSHCMHRERKKILGLATLVAGVLAVAPGLLQGQVRKTCEGGVTLKLNAAVTTQGSLVIVEVVGTKPFAEFAADWDGRAIPLWKEGEKTGTLHGLIGVDLEMAPGRYAWKVSWKNAAGEAKSCSASVTVRPGKFPTERLNVEKQFVQPDPEQEKRAEEDQKKMRAILESVTPERYWDSPPRRQFRAAQNSEWRSQITPCRSGFSGACGDAGFLHAGWKSGSRRGIVLFGEHRRD